MAQEQAGRFKVTTHPDFHKQQRRILYIGKATAGTFEEDDAAEHAFEHGQSSFWRFARKISRLADPAMDNLENLAWSNLIKQGVTSGNPKSLSEDQKAEAVGILRKEVADLKPNLIVLVTVGYEEDIPKAAFDIEDGETIGNDGKLKTLPVSDQAYSIWSREVYRAFPPIVWLNHPQGKRLEYTDAALHEIKRLTGWSGESAST